MRSQYPLKIQKKQDIIDVANLENVLGLLDHATKIRRVKLPGPLSLCLFPSRQISISTAHAELPLCRLCSCYLLLLLRGGNQSSTSIIVSRPRRGIALDIKIDRGSTPIRDDLNNCFAPRRIREVRSG